MRPVPLGLLLFIGHVFALDLGQGRLSFRIQVVGAGMKHSYSLLSIGGIYYKPDTWTTYFYLINRVEHT